MANSNLNQAQLKSFREKLELQSAKLSEQISVLSAGDPFADPEHASDNAAIDTDVREQLGHDTIEAEVKTLQTRLDLSKRALAKIDTGAYGICEKSGLPIPLSRLELLPEARYRIEFETSR